MSKNLSKVAFNLPRIIVISQLKITTPVPKISTGLGSRKRVCGMGGKEGKLNKRKVVKVSQK